MFCFEKSTSSFAANWRAHGVLPGTGEAVPGGGCEAAGEDETGVCAGGDAAGCAGLVCGETPGAGEAGAGLAGAAATWGPAWRSAQLALVFAAPIRRQLIPWR